MKRAVLTAAALVCIGNLSVTAQQISGEPTPLATLLQETRSANPDIATATHAWQASTHKAAQSRTLPDPKLTVQEFSVGSPRPFAGYTNSDFAYIGVGASQELPYPGKLRLRASVDERAADVAQEQVAQTTASVSESVKTAYLRLAYLQQTLTLLNESKEVLSELIKNAIAHYEVGQGMQQDVLQAQVEHIKLLREIAMHHQQMGELQAELKGLLHRPQSSPDIVAEPLTESVLHASVTDLIDHLNQANPEVRMQAATVRQQDAALASARREREPDFEVGYMYQNTDRKYRDYYMLTFNMRLPRRSRVNAEVSEASERLAAAQSQLDAETQKQQSELQRQFVALQAQDEVLKDDRAGILPASEAIYRATLNSYSANRDTLAHVLSAYLSLVNLKLDYEQTLLDRETALAHLETLTGESLR